MCATVSIEPPISLMLATSGLSIVSEVLREVLEARAVFAAGVSHGTDERKDDRDQDRGRSEQERRTDGPHEPVPHPSRFDRQNGRLVANTEIKLDGRVSADDADGYESLPRIATGAGQQEQRAGNQADRKHQVARVQTGGRLLLIQGEVAARRHHGQFFPDHECREGERNQQQDPADRTQTDTHCVQIDLRRFDSARSPNGGDHRTQMHGGQAKQHHVQGAIESDGRKLSAQHGLLVEAEHLETGLTGVEERRRDQEQVVAVKPATRDPRPRKNRPDAVGQDQAAEWIDERGRIQVERRNDQPAQHQQAHKDGLQERHGGRFATLSSDSGNHGRTTLGNGL